MSEATTLRCGLPLLQPAQAQKHVTVNDALMRLDGLVNLVLQSITTAEPPVTATDGMCYGVPALAAGAWAGQAGRIAIGANGGWVFAQPQRGQQAFVRDLGTSAIWTGAGWAPGAMTLGLFGSGTSAGLLEAEIAIPAGGAFTSTVALPANTIILGVTGRVVQPITGTATSWSLGVSGAATRYGSALGLGLNSWARGILTSPTAIYAPQNLLLTPAGGNFAGGRVRLAVHWLELRLPDAVA